MFSLCKQTHKATSVDFAISCYFFNNYEVNLVTAGANVLKIYKICPDVEKNSTEKYTDARPPKMRLECRASYTLFGNVEALQAVILTGSQRDGLLIGFKDAKLSVVQHDSDTYELKTLSLHYFEEEDIKGGWIGNYYPPIIKVDPDNRCAVMVAYGRKLIVLPFRKDNSLDEIEVQDVKPMKKPAIQLVAKTPILASYIITLKDLDEKIDNIIGIDFLHGYYEPTLLILYEPVRTFPGRIAVRTDTCTMIAISLNIQQRVHPIIWTVSLLPYDCTNIYSIKKPIGGCLIATVNALIYLNQSIPPYGVSLNSLADTSTSFPLKPQDGVKISLDCAQITFLSADKLVLSLKGGELYVLTLCVDSMRSVRNFHFSKAAASVLTSCITLIGEEYLFLGSRLGNSLLLRFVEKDQNTVITIDDTDVGNESAVSTAPPRRVEDEELEVYGSGLKTSVQLTSFTFEVCDSIFNMAPIGFMTIGERVADDEKDTIDDEMMRNHMEIVTSSGHGKNGAVCVLQYSVKPQVITSFGMAGCLDVWTVFDESQRENPHHAFMVLSQETASMILQTGDEINEIENTGFCITQSTVHVGNIGGNRYIVQVLKRSIRLLQGTRLIQNIQIDIDCSLTNVSICDPYICVRAENGQVITLALRESKGAPRLAINKNTISSTPAVITICAYRDVSGLFTHKLEDISQSSVQSAFDYASSGFGYMKQEPNLKIEDEEDLLYGESGNAFKMNTMANLAMKSHSKNTDWWKRLIQPVKPTFWLFVTRENGNLEIYMIPDMKLAYIVNNIGNGDKFLTDAMEFVPLSFANQSSGKLHDDGQKYDQFVNQALMPKEILIAGLGKNNTRPVLFVRTEVELLIYSVYKYNRGHLKIRFRKLNHEIIMPSQQKNFYSQEEEMDDDAQSERTICQLRYFDNIAGNNGVMLCGIKPYMILLTSRGELRTHQMFSQTIMKSMASFTHTNCPKGMIYFDAENQLQIVVLPNYLSYDSEWPVRKIPLKCTPTFITYHKQSKIYCLVLDKKEVSNTYYRFNGEDKELTEEAKGERFIYPAISKFVAVLLSPQSWEIVPETSIELDEWEHVISFKNVHLSYEGRRTGFKEYICLGTNYNYSEEITSRGRILIYDIIEVVPEPGKPLTKHKFKEIYNKDQKGPVSAITHVLGFLCTAIGQKIYLWQLKDNDLVGVAFIDTNIYVHQMISIKSMILVADVYKSISLLRFQEEFRTLSLVSRDYGLLNVLNIEFMVDNTNLGFLTTDCDENIIIYMYQPESRDSFGGQKLLRKSDYHLGQKINAMFRIQCNINSDLVAPMYDYKHADFFATLEGGMGFCIPLPEKTYRRLYMLQNVLLSHMDHLCGLNPKAFRSVKSQKRHLMNPSRGVVDGDLVWSFLNLPMNDKQEVAKKIGTRIEDIFADLREIRDVTSLF